MFAWLYFTDSPLKHDVSLEFVLMCQTSLASVLGSGCNLRAQLLSHVQLFCNRMDCSPPGSSVHGIFQARILEWVAISSFRGASWSRNWTWVDFLPTEPREKLLGCDLGYILSTASQVTSWFTGRQSVPRRNIVSNAEESWGPRTHPVPFPSTTWKDKNTVLRMALWSVICHLEFLQGCGFMPASAETRDEPGPWWIVGVWDSKCIEVDVFVIMFFLCPGPI